MTVPPPVRTPVRLRRFTAGADEAAVPGTAQPAHPVSGPLVDRFGRVHRDLRLSVTDRCNFRCTYCLPAEGATFRPRSELLDAEELVRVASVARRLGVTALRITGGEPLVRPRVVELVAGLARLGFEDLALTTNAARLADLARPLAAAGLHRVNISCDSLRADRFPTIRRRGNLAPVLAGMDAAESAGLRPIKVNVVLIRGVNEDEVLAFAAFARDTGRQVRFIEFMPLDEDHRWERSLVVPAEEVLRTVNSRWPLLPITEGADDSAPAVSYRFADGAPGGIGVVASVTAPFCGRCDRIRVTADGAIRNCLFSDDELSLRRLLRSGGSDADLAELFHRSVGSKRPGHGMDDPDFLRPRRSMSMIGG